MIFVSVGTQDKPFIRLLDIIEKAINDGIIKDKVIVQAGYTKYKSENMEIFDYISKKDYNNFVNKCDLLITHAGVGNIFTGLDLNKKIMVMPRLKDYKEHNNNHQLEITESFQKHGYILVFNNYDEFKLKYKELKDFEPRKYKSNTKNMIKLIENFINEGSR